MSQQPTLFETPPDPECSWCNGRGYWIWYRHGTKPELYPHIKCECTDTRTGAA